MPDRNTTNTNQDRELLIAFRAEVTTKLDRAIIDIKELKDNVAQRVSTLEQGKLDTAEANRLKMEADRVHQDHEVRVRFIERYLWAALGVLAVIQFIGFAFFFNELR